MSASLHYTIVILGYVATASSFIRTIPQILKVFVYKNSRDISFLTLGLGMTYAAIFTFVGFILLDYPLLLTNVILLFFNILLAIVTVIYRATHVKMDKHVLEIEYVELMIEKTNIIKEEKKRKKAEKLKLLK